MRRHTLQMQMKNTMWECHSPRLQPKLQPRLRPRLQPMLRPPFEARDAGGHTSDKPREHWVCPLTFTAPLMDLLSCSGGRRLKCSYRRCRSCDSAATFQERGKFERRPATSHRA